MGSSDSPRRLMSATLPVVGSQLMPYQLEQQLVPDHVLKMPKYGSLREDLKACNAARSDGVQLEVTVEMRVKRRASVVSSSTLISGDFVFCIFRRRMSAMKADCVVPERER